MPAVLGVWSIVNLSSILKEGMSTACPDNVMNITLYVIQGGVCAHRRSVHPAPQTFFFGVMTARTRSWLSMPLSFEVQMHFLLGEPVFAHSWGGAKHGCNVLICWDSRIRRTVNFDEELPDRRVTTLN